MLTKLVAFHANIKIWDKFRKICKKKGIGLSVQLNEVLKEWIKTSK